MRSLFFKIVSTFLLVFAVAGFFAPAQATPPVSDITMALVDPLQLAYADTSPVTIRFDFNNVANRAVFKFTNSLASFGSIDAVTESQLRVSGSSIQTVGSTRFINCVGPNGSGDEKTVSYRVDDNTGELVMFVGEHEFNSDLQLPPTAICPVMVSNLLPSQPFSVQVRWVTPVDSISRSKIVTLSYSAPAKPTTVMNAASELTLKLSGEYYVFEPTFNQLLYTYSTVNFLGTVTVDFRDNQGNGIAFEKQPLDQMQCRDGDENGVVIATIAATANPGQFTITPNEQYNSSAQDVFCSWQMPSRGLEIFSVIRQTDPSPTTPASTYTAFTKRVILPENRFTALLGGYTKTGIHETPSHLKVYFAVFPDVNDYFYLEFPEDSAHLFPFYALDTSGLTTACGPDTSITPEFTLNRVRINWTGSALPFGSTYKQFECTLPINQTLAQTSELDLANASQQLATTVWLKFTKPALSTTYDLLSQVYRDYKHNIYQPKGSLSVQFSGATFPLVTVQSTPTPSMKLQYQFSIARAPSVPSEHLAFSLQIVGGQVAVPVESYPNLFQCYVPGSTATAIPISYDEQSLEWLGNVYQTSFATTTSTLSVVCEIANYPLVQANGVTVYPHSIPELSIKALDLGNLQPGLTFLSKSFQAPSNYVLPTTPSHFGVSSFGAPTTPVIPQLTLNLDIQIANEADFFTTTPTTTYDGMIDEIHDVLVQSLADSHGSAFVAAVMAGVVRSFTVHGLKQSTATAVSSLANTQRIETRAMKSGSITWSNAQGLNDYDESSRHRVLGVSISYQLSSNAVLAYGQNQLQYLQHAADQLMLNAAKLNQIGQKYVITNVSSNQALIHQPTGCGFPNGVVQLATAPYDVLGVNYCNIGSPCTKSGDCQNNSPFEGFPVCAAGFCTVASFRDNTNYRNTNFVPPPAFIIEAVGLYNNNNPLAPVVITPSQDTLTPAPLQFPADHLLITFRINSEVIDESFYDSGQVQLAARLHKSLSNSFYAAPLTITGRTEGPGYWTFTATASLLDYPGLTAKWGTASSMSAFVQIDFLLYSAGPTDPNRKIVSMSRSSSDFFKMSYKTYRAVVAYSPSTCPACPASPSTQTLVTNQCWDDSVTPSVQVQTWMCHAQSPPTTLACSCS